MPRHPERIPFGNPNDPQGMLARRDQFLEWLRIKNFSAQTVASRNVYLDFFIRWCEDRGIVRPGAVSKPILERYQRWLYHYRKKDGKPLSFRSQFNRLLPIRAWFKWLARNNHVLFNPAAEMELPKLEQRLPKCILTVADADAVLNMPNVETALGIRDRAIMETLYSSGIRRMEVVGLRIYDIERQHGTLIVRLGKGKKDRIVPIGERALAWIERYEQEVRPSLLVGDGAGDTLFLSNLGAPLKAEWLSLLVRRYIDAAQLGKTGSCHLFRHSMATTMLENGADIRFIQVLLGHAKLETTAIYTQVSIQKLKAVHEATHPTAKLKRKQADETLDP